jgi:hypothetical protein
MRSSVKSVQGAAAARLGSRIAATAVIVGITAAIVVAVIAPWSPPSAASPAAVFSNGAVALPDGRSAVLDARGMAPGEALTGELVIGNRGRAAGRFWLGTRSLLDQPGQGGGSLARALTLVVTDVTQTAAPRVVYSGPLAGLSSVDLGTFAPGEHRIFRLSAQLCGATADQAFAGSRLSVAFDWTAVTTG